MGDFDYVISRPPAHLKSFGMPSKADLESLKIGDDVKVIVKQDGRVAERLWCKIRILGEEGDITATLQNTPFNLHLKPSIDFHVTDIIDIWEDGRIEA